MLVVTVLLTQLPRNNQLCPWLPLCRHLHRVDIQETSGAGRDLQPFPRLPLHRDQRARFVSLQEQAVSPEASAVHPPPSPFPLTGSNRRGVGFGQVKCRVQVYSRIFLAFSRGPQPRQSSRGRQNGPLVAVSW